MANSPVSLAVLPLSQAAFAPFGDVLERADAHTYLINGGTTTRYHALAHIETPPQHRPVINIFRGDARPLPFVFNLLERHPLASQAFMPLSPHPYLVVVAEPGDNIDESTLRAFLAQPSQGVQYAPGVWHHALLALSPHADFLVIDAGDLENNCDEVTLSRHYSVSVSKRDDQ